MTRAEMLAELIERRERLKKQAARPEAVTMLAEADALEKKLIDGDVPEAEWEQFLFNWDLLLADLMRDIRNATAKIMLAFENIDLKDPETFANDQQVQKLLRWWREEGGREQFLGSLPLEERRQLEEESRKRREKNP